MNDLSRFAEARQLSLEEILAEAEKIADGNGLKPGTPVKHADLDVYGIYEGPGRRPGIARVRITAGWTCEPPPAPVSIPYANLEVVG